jgi:TonB family protein
MRFRTAIAIFLTPLCVGICLAQSPLRGRTSEAILRRMATMTVVPTFPEDAASRNETGVAVSEIQLDISGHVTAVRVLQAPSRSISDSVSVALQKWEFRPPLGPDHKPILISGKVTFYFEKVGGVGHVYNPSDLGYVGTWQSQPAASTQKK